MITYIINMKKDEGRLLHMQKAMTSYNMKYERVDAVNGRALPKNEVLSFGPHKRYKTWSLGALGCFISHRLAWQKIAQYDDEWGLVLEDDMRFASDFKKYISDIDILPKDADIIRLEASPNRLKLRKKRSFKDRNIYKVLSSSWCAGGYIINKRTAQALVKVPSEEWDCADYFLFDKNTSEISKKLNIYQVVSAICVQEKYLNNDVDDIFKSNIEPDGNHKTYSENKKLHKNIWVKLKKFIGRYKRVSFAE